MDKKYIKKQMLLKYHTKRIVPIKKYSKRKRFVLKTKLFQFLSTKLYRIEILCTHFKQLRRRCMSVYRKSDNCIACGSLFILAKNAKNMDKLNSINNISKLYMNKQKSNNRIFKKEVS